MRRALTQLSNSLSGRILFAALFISAIIPIAYAAPPGLKTSSGWSLYLPAVLSASGPLPRPGLADGLPTWGAPLAVSPLDGAVWVVNPDAGSISAVAPVRRVKIAEIQVGVEPWSLALSPDGLWAYVVDRAQGELVLVDLQTGAVRARLAVGPEPGMVALSPSGGRAYVTVTAADRVAVIDTPRFALAASIPVEPRPYAIAVSDDGDAADDDEQIYITHFQALPKPGGIEGHDDSRRGLLSVIAAGSRQVSRQIALEPDEHGFPNLLAGISLSGAFLWAPHQRAAPDLPNTLTKIVFASVAVVDVQTYSEDSAARLLLNDQDIFGSPVNSPLAAVPSPDGKTLYIVLAGSDLLEIVDIADPHQPRLVEFLPVGRNPRGLALSPDGRTGYVMNYLSRSLSLLDLENMQPLAEIPTTQETLPPHILLGKILFNNASDPRLSQGSWISCASCHPDGGSDGVTWMFPDGPRQAPALWNAAHTLPWHWSAALDEAQDVETTIQVIQFGLGLGPGLDPPLLGAPLAGHSTALDALAAFLETAIRPAQPAPAGESVSPGRALFQSAGCAACHGGPFWTSSALPGPAGELDPDGNGMVDAVLRQVGVHNPQDVRGAEGFDPPSLLGVGLTAPYFHDGSMPALEALLASGHPAPGGTGNGLDSQQIALLVAFLRSIGPDTEPVVTP